jgi:hypothetical protein
MPVNATRQRHDALHGQGEHGCLEAGRGENRTSPSTPAMSWCTVDLVTPVGGLWGVQAHL